MKKLLYKIGYCYIADTNFVKKIKRFLGKGNMGVLPSEAQSKILDEESTYLKCDLTFSKKPKIGIVRDSMFDENYVSPRASWLKYERYCIVNNIPYGEYNIFASNWLEEAQKFDIIVWHTASTPIQKNMAESKIYILEKYLNKLCFPSFHEIWQYEDKRIASYLYKQLDIPHIPTFVSYDRNETLQYIKTKSYPLIFKTSIGASSSGVELVKTYEHAKKIVDKIFSFEGRETTFDYNRQKDYVIIQDFIDDATFDLRIMLVGDKAFGYYRYPKKGDFKASGSGLLEKKSLPKEALDLAVDVRNKLQSRQLGVDLLYSEKLSKYMVIETSLFNSIGTPRQLEIDGVAGYYDISNPRDIKFYPGEFWIQEVMLDSLVKEWIRDN